MDKSGLINSILCRISALKEMSSFFVLLLLFYHYYQDNFIYLALQLIFFRLISIILFIPKLENVFNISSPSQKKQNNTR